MNTDVLQRIFEFAEVEERCAMRVAFGEIFRYPHVRSVDVSIRPIEINDWITGGLLKSPFWSRAYFPYLTDRSRVYAYLVGDSGYNYSLVVGPYRIEKSLCYFCGQEKVATFVGEHGVYANKCVGSTCIFPWIIRPACNKPRSRGFG
jgi:hypothetical protein